MDRADRSNLYDEWRRNDPAGLLPANPFRSPFSRLQDHPHCFHGEEGEYAEFDPEALLSRLYWAVPALIVAIVGGFLLGGWAAGF